MLSLGWCGLGLLLIMVGVHGLTVKKVPPHYNIHLESTFQPRNTTYPAVFTKSFKRVAICDPVKVTTPEKTMITTNSKTTGANFASHRMVFGFGLGIYSGAISIGVEVGPITIEIKFT